ncbi:MBL fold metallo-hydrolase [Candidatus Parcubacteria bacterium]|nr:MAG: MBL fold metallo-hydrolase [Candidatus Parcubacteria bacterium]
MSKLLKKIKWLGHASFKIETDKIIYIDPYEIEEKEKADLILITHEHYDHCSPEDIKKIIKNDTAIVTISSAASKLSGNIKIVNPGDEIEIEGIRIKAVPSYNINKKFHPRDSNKVGFLVTIEGETVYHAGDTDFIPEMKDIKTDIALLPVSGTYVMDPLEASKAAEIIKPKYVIPMHYGSIVGSREDAEKFKGLYTGETVIYDIYR